MSDLIVKRGAAEVPFSRGILARSLLKLGLEATRAYDIATKIYHDLQSEGMSLVTTQHLARILSRRIARYAGHEFGERYEKLRLFKRSTRPLVLLVGGS
ncbi:MAG: ATP cone domain-containing protein, partial [Candidatus Krumholzibacteriia bacterium]